MYKSFAAALALLSLTAEAALRFTGCPKKDGLAMPNFDSDRYLGQWYENQADKYIPFELGKGCQVAHYSANEDGSLTAFN